MCAISVVLWGSWASSVPLNPPEQDVFRIKDHYGSGSGCHGFQTLPMRSDTVLIGIPLRLTFTWMKSVAGERLEPSAFNK